MFRDLGFKYVPVSDDQPGSLTAVAPDENAAVARGFFSVRDRLRESGWQLKGSLEARKGDLFLRKTRDRRQVKPPIDREVVVSNDPQALEEVRAIAERELP